MDGDGPGGGQARRRWMGVLAMSEPAALESAWTGLAEPPAYEILRRPEVGLVMVRGRVGGIGAPFNLGEMTVTRCAVRLAGGITGHGWVAGRAPRHAELAAAFDALLQDPARGPAVLDDVIGGLANAIEARRRERAARTQATRVDFFTLVRGDE
jgi:alpha-D-ribose 1-methylphosphonate 5-triphosphate synthase subunit PhnG